MRISTLTALILPSAFLFVACGSDGGGGGKGSEVTDPNTVQSAKGTAEATKTLTAIQPGADSAAGQGAVSQVGGSMMNLVNGYKAAKLQAAAGSAAQPQTTPGTFTYENDHMSADFTYSQANYNIQYKVELDLPTVDGARVIDGTVDMSFQATAQSFNIDYVYGAVYSGFTLDSTGCATAGSIAVDYDMSLSGAGYDSLPAESKKAIDQQYGTGTVTVEFGPACGDVKVFGN